MLNKHWFLDKPSNSVVALRYCLTCLCCNDKPAFPHHKKKKKKRSVYDVTAVILWFRYFKGGGGEIKESLFGYRNSNRWRLNTIIYIYDKIQGDYFFVLINSRHTRTSVEMETGTCYSQSIVSYRINFRYVLFFSEISVHVDYTVIFSIGKNNPT